MCTGWFKRKVLSTAGFPSRIVHAPKVKYEVRKAQGRGLGVFATEDIAAGDLLLAERPLLVRMAWIPVTPDDEYLGAEQELRGLLTDWEQTLETICARMSPQTLKTYHSLYNSYKTDGSGPLTGIWRTNGLDVGVEDPLAYQEGVRPGYGRYSCVGATCSRFNHSCSPNATFTFNMPSFTMEIHAVRSIAMGEEITVAYVNVEDDAVIRQAALRPYGFACVCAACTSPATSDTERKRAFSSLLPKTSQGVENANASLAAFEETGLQSHPRYLELLRRVAKIHQKKGSKERADALEVLADRVTTAQQGRRPVGERMSDTTSSEAALQSIMARTNTNERISMLQDLMQKMAVRE
ncbi:SET domain-containing protein [Peniophora sp. CONT]|nr:SET domain-containing protein [Peniophora sp. CONT]